MKSLKIHFLKPFLLFFFIFFQTLSFGQNIANGIVFFSVDNTVKVMVNNLTVFESDDLCEEDEMNLEIDLQDYLSKPSDIVRVIVYNLDCMECLGSNPWEVSYELYKDGSSIDYIQENGDGKGGGEVFQIQHIWEDL